MLNSLFKWQVIGFESQKILFKSHLDNSSFGHAYLFTGSEMIGKYTFAKELVKLIHGRNTIYNPDTLIVDSSISHVSIDEIRTIKRFLSQSPYESNYTVTIINNAHHMGHEAQNALLKVLEEAHPSSIIFLITHNPSQLLETVRSRCQNILFENHKLIVSENLLSQTELNKDQRIFIANFCHGRLGLLISIIKNKSYSDLKKTIGELAQLIKDPLWKRLQYAQKINKEDQVLLSEKVLYWIFYLHSQPINLPKSLLLRNILNLYTMLQHNGRNNLLAVERFVMAI